MLFKPHLTTNMLVETIPPNGDDPFVERIIWIRSDHTYCYVIDMNGPGKTRKYRCVEIYEDIAEGIKIILTVDHYAPDYMILDHDLSESQQKCIREVWPELSKIVARGEMAFEKKGLAGLLAQSPLGAKRLRRALLRYWRSGQMRNAIAPRHDRRGGAGKQRRRQQSTHEPVTRKFCSITPEIKSLMQKGYNEFYVNKKARTVRHALQKTLEKYFNNGFSLEPDGTRTPLLKPRQECPSYQQFLRHCHYARDRETVAKKRYGGAHTALNYNPRLGSVNQAVYGPGSAGFVDSTLTEATLVSSLNRSRVIGRPIVYLLVDGFSFAIMGYALSLETASWPAQIAVIMNAATDKVEYCRRFGIEISRSDWPCQHLPQMIIGDRGELMSQQASNLINILNVEVSNNPSYMPVMKGLVELAFNLLNTYALQDLPGGGERPRRPLPDIRGTPCLTLYELHQIVIRYILAHNKGHILQEYAPSADMIADGVEHTPLKLWEWGVQNRSGLLRTASPQTVYAALLPRETGSITPQGIRFKKRRYQVVSDRLKEEERRWYVRAREGRIPVTVAYDPRTTNYIYLCLPGNQLVRCELLARDGAFANRVWSEIDDYEQFLSEQQKKMEHRRRQHLADFHAHVQAIVEPAELAAQQQREAEGISKNALEQNVRVYRAVEKVLERSRDLGLLEPHFAPSDERPPTARPVATNGIRKIFELEILTAFLEQFETETDDETK
jgi:putative transposase